jgi:hypothetical protein
MPLFTIASAVLLARRSVKSTLVLRKKAIAWTVVGLTLILNVAMLFGIWAAVAY